MGAEFDAKWLEDYCKRTGQPNPLEGQKAPKRAKYGNRKTEADGRLYDSAKEARRHGELKLMQQAGEIVAWAEQVNFRLPGGVTYRADFVILNRDGTYRVEDAKGVKTKEYVIKKKLMSRELGIEIVEV